MDTKIVSRPEGRMTGYFAMVMLLFVVLFVGAKAQSAAPPVSPHDEDWGWCITSAGDKPVCDEMIKILEGLDPEKSHKYSCVVGEGPEDCMKKISAGEAKIGVFDGGNIRKASSKYQLKPVRLEITGTSTDKYYSVGIVKSRNCPRNLGSLRGKRSCHSGYGRSAGWTIPLTFLVNNNIMPVITSGPSSNDIQSLKYFFLRSCAATNDNTKAICSACKNTTRCTQEDEYYDYHGAFRGLVEDSCDIAFTKHSVPSDYASNGPNAQSDWVGLGPASDYALMCPTPLDGESCTDIANYAKCNFGSAPPHTVFVSVTWPDLELKEFHAVMDAANNDLAFNRLFFQGNNKAGTIFVADATKTLSYAGTADTLVGPLEKAVNSLEAINDLKPVNSAACAHHLPSGRATAVALAVSSIVWAAASTL